MTVKIVYMNSHRDAVDNAIEHLDKKYGLANTWYQDCQRWDNEWGLSIMRTNLGDSILFQNEQEYMVWLLKWS